LNPKTLSWWRWNLRQQAEASPRSRFVEFSVLPERSAPEPERSAPEVETGPLVIELLDVRAKVRVTGHTDLELLRQVLEVLC
jgi:hypothetical protein